MRCDTCKHWKEHTHWDIKTAGLRECEAVRQLWDVEDDVPKTLSEVDDAMSDLEAGVDLTPDRKILADEYIKAVDRVFGAAKAVVNDGSQYIAELLTRHDFGCVLHQPKE